MQLDVQNVYVVLGGGLNHEGKLHPHAIDRVRCAVNLIKSEDSVIFSSRYSLNTPPKLDSLGFPLSEAKVMMEYYRSNGGISKNLYLENASTDTIGSAIFIKLLFGWLLENRNIYIITSDFHLKRATIIFEKVLSIARPFLQIKELKFIGTKGQSRNISREQRELLQTNSFSEEYGSFTSINQFIYELVHNHDNYNTNYKSACNNGDKLLY